MNRISEIFTPRMLRNLFLMERDHLLFQARSELMKQEQKVESMNFSNKLLLNDWNWRTPFTDTLNLDENKCDYKKN